MAPTILLVPGFWEGTSPYDALTQLLLGPTTGLEDVQVHSHPSTGHTSPENHRMSNDIAALRAKLTSLVRDQGKEVLIVAHSAGGFLSASATEGLNEGQQHEAPDSSGGGDGGGVVGFVFLAAGLLPQGGEHPAELPFFEVKDGALFCKSPATLLFNDLPDSSKDFWVQKLQPQPHPSVYFDTAIPYTGWKDVKSTYVLCEQDAIIPPEMQMQMTEMAGCEIVRVDAGHMVQISKPDRIAEIIREVVECLKG